MIADTMVLCDCHHVFGGEYTDFRHPFGIYVQATSALLHDPGVKLLSFFAQNQLTTTFVASGCGGFLTMPGTPYPLLAGSPSFGVGTSLIGNPAAKYGSYSDRPKPILIASLPLARASAI
jgi:hypothetical protein